MGDKLLVFLGTWGLAAFNILTVFFAIVLFKDVSFWLALTITVVLGAAALFFDWLVGRYFVAVIKRKLKERKDGKV